MTEPTLSDIGAELKLQTEILRRVENTQIGQGEDIKTLWGKISLLEISGEKQDIRLNFAESSLKSVLLSIHEKAVDNAKQELTEDHDRRSFKAMVFICILGWLLNLAITGFSNIVSPLHTLAK